MLGHYRIVGLHPQYFTGTQAERLLQDERRSQPRVAIRGHVRGDVSRRRGAHGHRVLRHIRGAPGGQNRMRPDQLAFEGWQNALHCCHQVFHVGLGDPLIVFDLDDQVVELQRGSWAEPVVNKVRDERHQRTPVLLGR